MVETKLWRNPEARRQVVAQLIDYAAHIRSWRYKDLEAILKRHGTGRATLWEIVNPEGFTEAEWIDRVNTNLARGRMTLLVVGDGIRSETEALVETVGNQPEFPFRLALVELRLFRLADERYLVVPATIAKTAEIERAIVRIEAGKVSVETPLEDPGRLRSGVLSEDALLEELRRRPDGDAAAQAARKLLRLLQPPLEAVWRSSSFTIKMPDPAGSGRMLSLGVVDDSGILYAYISWLEKQLADLWKDSKAGERVTTAQLRLFKKYGAKVSRTGKQHDLKLASLAGKEDEFVTDLVRLAALIEETAAKQS